MGTIFRFFRDIMNLHYGQRGVHRWAGWRERTWCRYCGKDAEPGDHP